MSTVQTAIGRFTWHDHISSDAEGAQEFYKELFGWETEIWRPGGFDYPMIMVNGQSHGGFGPAQGGAPPHWLGHVCVEDVDAAASRAEEAGGKLVAPAMDIPEVGRMAILADPQGAIFSVFAPAGDPPTSEGVFVWDELTTSDVEAAKEFYGKVVGWSARDMDLGEGNTYTLFSTGETDRAGAMPLPPGAPMPAWLAYIGCDDVDATAARAEELGGSALMGPLDATGVGRLAVLTDSTGAAFGIFKPA